MPFCSIDRLTGLKRKKPTLRKYHYHWILYEKSNFREFTCSLFSIHIVTINCIFLNFKTKILTQHCSRVRGGQRIQNMRQNVREKMRELEGETERDRVKKREEEKREQNRIYISIFKRLFHGGKLNNCMDEKELNYGECRIQI